MTLLKVYPMNSSAPAIDRHERSRPFVSSEATAILAELQLALEQDPQSARLVALRLVSVLTKATIDGAHARGSLAPWQKRKIDGYMNEHLEKPLQVENLARQIQLSIGHFSRAFKASYGTSPHSHIVHLRLGRAKMLLSTTDMPLSQVAIACGFADQAHLSRHFRRMLNETPRQWRRENLHETFNDEFNSAD